MEQENYPKEITKENLPELVEQAKKTKRKYHIVFYGSVTIYSLVGFFVAPLLLSFSGQVVISSYSSTTMPSPLELGIAIIALFIVAYLVFLLYFLIILENIIKRIVRLRYSELVFYDCVLIINSLIHGKKNDALKEVNGFVNALFSYQQDYFNIESKRYKPEISKLKIGKSQLKRMILFSTENISDLFANFGLALLNGEHPTAYQHLQNIIHEASAYGKIEGWFDKIGGKATNLQIVVTIISLMVGIGASLVTIITLFG